MAKRLKFLALAGLALVLLLSTVLYGCGGGSTASTNTVTFGWLADQTGASAQAFKEVMKGINDYQTEMQANDPIPGIKINIITYDTRLEYARFPQGYQFLKGQGMDLLLGYQPETPLVTQKDQAADQIPQYNFSAHPSTLDADWVYGYMCTYEYEGRAVLDYLVNTWWPAQAKNRALKVALVHNPEMGSGGEYRKGMEWVVSQNPGEVELRVIGGSSSQTAWASEVASMMDTDVAFLSTVGTSSGTFIKEAIDRGYQGRIVGATMAVLGIWPMVTSLVSKAKLDKLMIAHYYPLYTDGTPYTTDLNAMIEKYRGTEATALKKGTTWLSGWLFSQILTKVVRDAATAVGPEKVDGAALNNALLNLNLEIEGMPAITNRGTHHVLQPSCRIIEYRAANDDFYAVSDWFLPPGFAA